MPDSDLLRRLAKVIAFIPFVLPMMLQVGFGLTPFESGSLTFASAAGALCMKFAAPPILRRLGFRRVLVANSWICALFLAASALSARRFTKAIASGKFSPAWAFPR